MPLAGRGAGLLRRLQLPLQFGDLRVLLLEPLRRRLTAGFLRGHVVPQALHLGTLPGDRGRLLVRGLGNMGGLGRRLLPGVRPRGRGQQHAGQRQPGRAAPHR